MNFDDVFAGVDDYDEEDDQKERGRSGIERVSMFKYSETTTLKKTEVITKDSFKLVKKLGKGSYGTVYLVEKTDTKV